MSFRISRIVSTAFIILLGSALGFPDPVRAADKVTFGLPLDASFSYMFVAQEKGYFSDEGIDITFLPASGSVANAGLIGGSIQYSAAVSTAVNAIMRGAPLKVIFVTQRRSTHRLWSFDPAVTDLNQLRGKLVAVGARGDAEEFAMRSLMMARGLPSDFVGFAPYPAGAPRTSAIISGAQRYAMLTKIEEAPLRQAGTLGKGKILVDFAKEIEIPIGGIATSDAQLAEHADLTRRFLRATVKGIIFLRQHQPEAVAITQKRFPSLPREDVVLAVNDLIDSATTDGTISPDAIKRDIAVHGEVLEMSASALPPADKIYNFSLIKAVDHELAASGWTASN